ncbi:MAG: class I SAM-dependent methyltransferase, partial [Planctomycetes bacterium]|nr:class I SAM-dependent methyltransferase [Planctomycetota bacterium]
MTRPKADQKAPGSFRDPSGFLFCRDGVLYRQVNKCYRSEYDLLMNSGCYHSLVDAGLLVAHSEEGIEPTIGEEGFRIIKPDLIGFVSYPYEWSFSQLKDAALTTIRIQKKALEFGMSLKDCSAYNVQFSKGKPVFIDTLSFEKYARGKPWMAYRQFCQHFLAPLALMSYTDVRLSQLLRIYMDGIALDLASSLLPIRARLKFSLLTHIFVHARSQRHFEDRKVSSGRYKLSELSFRGLIDSLESAIRRLKWRPEGTEWGEYYDDTNYSSCANEHKRRLVEQFCDRVNPKNVWDLGSNTGTFGRIAASKGIQTVCFDIDPAAVEKNYLSCIEEGQTNVLPLLVDLRNPSG